MKAYLSIGSNIHPEKNIPACLKRLKSDFRLRKISSVYETSPVGPAGKGNFWNLGAIVESRLTRNALLAKLRRLESELGRARTRRKYGPRSIDIDLVFYGGWQRTGFERLGFVLIPLAEIAPGFRPGPEGLSLRKLACCFFDPAQKIRKLKKPSF